MAFLRSRRTAAVLLAIAAVVGLTLANTPAHSAVAAVFQTRVGWTVEEWVQDALLAMFYLVAGVELRHEFQGGSLSSPGRAAVPAVAAVGGVLTAIAIYLAVAPRDVLAGWPVPTATDIAFSLGVLSLFGREHTGRLRAFLLALAVVNDVIGLVLVTIVGGLDAHRIPTLAAVALGVALPRRVGAAVVVYLEPWVNGLVLPLFAVVAAFVPVAGLDPAQLQLTFTVAGAMVVGQFVGIAGLGALASRILVRDREHRLRAREVVTGGALGGIGFTVSLLLARLAFRDDPSAANAAVLGVLIGTAIAVLISAVLLRIVRHSPD